MAVPVPLLSCNSEPARGTLCGTGRRFLPAQPQVGLCARVPASGSFQAISGMSSKSAGQMHFWVLAGVLSMSAFGGVGFELEEVVEALWGRFR